MPWEPWGLLVVCAITGPTPPGMGEGRPRFRFRQRQMAMAAITPAVAKPAPMPIPATAEVESLTFSTGGEGAWPHELGVAGEVVWAGDVFEGTIAGVEMKDS